MVRDSFDKYTIYHGRGTGIRKVSKENASENNKTET